MAAAKAAAAAWGAGGTVEGARAAGAKSLPQALAEGAVGVKEAAARAAARAAAVTAGVMGRCQTRTQPCDTAARSAASLWPA